MSMNCFGILAQNSRNILYNGLDCTPKEGRTVVSDADFFHFSGCSGEVKVINCAARYSSCGDDVIRYEPVVMDKSSVTPVHKKLILRNNRFISGTGRKYTVNLSYLGEAVIEKNTSDVELVITKIK